MNMDKQIQNPIDQASKESKDILMYKKITLLIVLMLTLVLLSFLFKDQKNEIISKNPVVIHEAGHLYKISDHIYFRRCSVDGLDHFDITGIDAETFQYVNDVYVKDNNSIWNLGETKRCGYPIQLTLNPAVDLPTFSVFATSSFVAKDKNSLIYNDRRLTFPSQSTIYLGFGYYKDAGQILKHAGSGNLLPLKSVPAEARPISLNYLVDSKHVYDARNVYREKEDAFVVEGADPVSFKELSNGYSLDKNNVYFYSKIVPLADPLSFEKVTGQAENDEYCGFSYWKDTHRVYLKGNTIQSADPYTFKVIPYQGRNCNNGQYSVDKDHVFYNETLLNEIDVKTFVYKGGLTVADSNNIYVAGIKCFSKDTLIENKELGYSLHIPKGWKYDSDPKDSRDFISNCAGHEGFSITKGPVFKRDGQRVLNIPKQFIPNATITGWLYETEHGSVYEYEIFFDKEKVTLQVSLEGSIENLPILSTLVPVVF